MDDEVYQTPSTKIPDEVYQTPRPMVSMPLKLLFHLQFKKIEWTLLMKNRMIKIGITLQELDENLFVILMFC
jgi:hypothetical protein